MATPTIFEPVPQVTPFVGGEVFNPANWVRITNNDPNSWGRFVPGAIVQGGAPPQPVWVTGSAKHAKQAIHGRYNGKDYLFPFGVPVNTPIEAARHIFALGLDDKSGALNRLGWARSSDEVSDAMDRLCNFIRFEDLPELMEAARFAPAGGSPQDQTVVAHASGLVKGDGAEGETHKVSPNVPAKKG